MHIALPLGAFSLSASCLYSFRKILLAVNRCFYCPCAPLSCALWFRHGFILPRWVLSFIGVLRRKLAGKNKMVTKWVQWVRFFVCREAKRRQSDGKGGCFRSALSWFWYARRGASAEKLFFSCDLAVKQ